jgi:hypothetical protein
MWDDEPGKRTLGIRERQILWERANHKCEVCGKKIDFTEIQVGHKTAYSKGGSTTLRNSACLCYRCNKLQGTDSWNTFLKKMGKETGESKTKNFLKTLSLPKLKYLTKKYNITVKGKSEEGLFSNNQVAPSKKQYIKALSKLSQEKIDLALKRMPQSEKKNKRKKRSFDWL